MFRYTCSIGSTTAVPTFIHKGAFFAPHTTLNLHSTTLGIEAAKQTQPRCSPPFWFVLVERQGNFHRICTWSPSRKKASPKIGYLTSGATEVHRISASPPRRQCTSTRRQQRRTPSTHYITSTTTSLYLLVVTPPYLTWCKSAPTQGQEYASTFSWKQQ